MTDNTTNFETLLDDIYTHFLNGNADEKVSIFGPSTVILDNDLYFEIESGLNWDQKYFLGVKVPWWGDATLYIANHEGDCFIFDGFVDTIMDLEYETKISRKQLENFREMLKKL